MGAFQLTDERLFYYLTSVSINRTYVRLGRRLVWKGNAMHCARGPVLWPRQRRILPVPVLLGPPCAPLLRTRRCVLRACITIFLQKKGWQMSCSLNILL